MIEQAILTRRPLPEKIKNAPALLLGLELFFIGFLDLNDERSIGMDSGPIPWRAMHEYCMVHGIVGEQREDFFYHVKQLDAAYLRWRADRLEKERPRVGPETSNG